MSDMTYVLRRFYVTSLLNILFEKTLSQYRVDIENSNDEHFRRNSNTNIITLYY